MALNQVVDIPLTLYSGSITSHIEPNGPVLGQVLHMPTGSLPSFSLADGWKYVIKTNPFTTTLATQQPVNDLTVRFDNSSRYLVIGYLSGASSATLQGFRVGVNATALTSNVYSIEVPTSATGIPTIGNNQNSNAAAAPVSDATNYYFVKITALVVTAATGTPTYIPTVSTETAGNTAAIGPSIIYYKKY